MKWEKFSLRGKASQREEEIAGKSLRCAQADPKNVPYPVKTQAHTDGCEKTGTAAEPGCGDILAEKQQEAKRVRGAN